MCATARGACAPLGNVWQAGAREQRRLGITGRHGAPTAHLRDVRCTQKLPPVSTSIVVVRWGWGRTPQREHEHTPTHPFCFCRIWQIGHRVPTPGVAFFKGAWFRFDSQVRGARSVLVFVLFPLILSLFFGRRRCRGASRVTRRVVGRRGKRGEGRLWVRSPANSRTSFSRDKKDDRTIGSGNLVPF